MDKDKLLDILLLSRDFYKKLTDKKLSLVIGIIILGIIDLAIPVCEKYKTLFTGRSQGDLHYNVSLVVLFVILIGLIDVLFFSLPLFDLFKKFKKEVEIQSSSKLVVKIMKIQITANLLILIPSVILYFLDRNTNYDKYPLMGEIAFFLYVLIFIWFSAAISRGINSIYSFEPLYRRLVFSVVFLWAFILGNFTISYVVNNLIMDLFK